MSSSRARPPATRGAGASRIPRTGPTSSPSPSSPPPPSRRAARASAPRSSSSATAIPWSWPSISRRSTRSPRAASSAASVWAGGRRSSRSSAPPSTRAAAKPTRSCASSRSCGRRRTRPSRASSSASATSASRPSPCRSRIRRSGWGATARAPSGASSRSATAGTPCRGRRRSSGTGSLGCGRRPTRPVARSRRSRSRSASTWRTSSSPGGPRPSWTASASTSSSASATWCSCSAARTPRGCWRSWSWSPGRSGPRSMRPEAGRPTPGPGSRRWLIVAALFVVTFGIATPLAAYGVFLPVLAEAFGWSRGAISTALSINLLLGGLAGFGIGALADRHGQRVLLVLTVALAGLAFALVATVGALWQLHLFVGVLGGGGMSSFYLLSAATVTRWFEERRGLALGLVLVGFNLGYIVGGPLAAWLIAAVGWRGAYALLGSGCGLLTTLTALPVRLPRASEIVLAPRHGPRPAVEPGVTLREALADPGHWCLNVGWLLLGGLAMMVSVHIVPFARDQGISLAGASFALTAYGVGAVSGRLVSGAASDRLGTFATIRIAYAIEAVALATLVWLPSREALLGSLIAFGVGFAASDTMITKVIPDVFGMRAIGAIMGVLTLGWRCGAALGPAAAGFLYDLTGSYAVPFGAAPLAVLASWALFELGTSRRRRETE